MRRPVLLSTREEGKEARVEEVLWRGGADLEAPRFRIGPTLPTNATPAPGGLAPVADDATVLFRRPGRPETVSRGGNQKTLLFVSDVPRKASTVFPEREQKLIDPAQGWHGGGNR